jgi:hypothetical protein
MKRAICRQCGVPKPKTSRSGHPGRRSQACAVAAGVLSAFLAGCGGGGVTGAEVAPLRGPVPAKSDVVEFYAVTPDGRRELKPEPPAPLLKPMAPAPSGWHMGVRAAVVRQPDAGGDRTAEDDAQTVSLFFRRANGSGRGAAFDLALGYSLLRAGNLEPLRASWGSPDFYVARMDALLQFGGSAFAPYLGLGVGGWVPETDAADSALVSAEAVFGLGSPGGQWDLRFTYSFVSKGNEWENFAEMSFGIGF